MKSWIKLISLVQIPAFLCLSVVTNHPNARAQGSESDCWNYVTQLGGDSTTAQTICASYPQYAGYCANNVIQTGGNWQRAIEVCQYGTRFSGSCFNSVVAQGANWNDATSVCKDANNETASCIQTALGQDNFTWKGAISLCQPPASANALQNCMNAIQYNVQGKPTGISSAAAEQECNRGR